MHECAHVLVCECVCACVLLCMCMCACACVHAGVRVRVCSVCVCEHACVSGWLPHCSRRAVRLGADTGSRGWTGLV